jgi:hypothetical protein
MAYAITAIVTTFNAGLLTADADRHRREARIATGSGRRSRANLNRWVAVFAR